MRSELDLLEGPKAYTTTDLDTFCTLTKERCLSEAKVWRLRHICTLRRLLLKVRGRDASSDLSQSWRQTTHCAICISADFHSTPRCRGVRQPPDRSGYGQAVWRKKVEAVFSCQTPAISAVRARYRKTGWNRGHNRRGTQHRRPRPECSGRYRGSAQDLPPEGSLRGTRKRPEPGDVILLRCL
ncbi:hypothetical protein VTK56DRAFT_8936 [Thermocarpiscus australiensis]